MNKNIITLTGFMGCGKSYAGRVLARETGFNLIDSDAEIERRQGKTIPQIMSEVGEQGFRKIETEVLTELLQHDFTVLSVGGGAIIHNAKLLCDGSTVFFLDTDFEKCYARIKNDVNRPLVYGKSKDEVFALYKSRIEIYKNNCHFALKNQDSGESAKKIKEIIKNY